MLIDLFLVRKSKGLGKVDDTKTRQLVHKSNVLKPMAYSVMKIGETEIWVV